MGFSWTQTISVGSNIEAADIGEIRTQCDNLDNAIVYCATHYTTHYSANYAYYGSHYTYNAANYGNWSAHYTAYSA